jgi:V8-like Glu-specific endopeptidase
MRERWLLCAGLAACSVEQAADVGYVAAGIQIGSNQSVIVSANRDNVPRALAPALDAVGRMAGIACTGTHIGDNLVLTAAHCLLAESLEDCRGTSIEWGSRLASCERVVFAELNDDRDIAVFVADSAPAAQLSIDTCRMRGPGDRVSLLGYPERGPQQWSGFCMLESLPDLGKSQIAHVCDTQPGSSGAPVIDAESGKVIGVHTGAAAAWNQATLLAKAHELFGTDCACDAL